MIDLLEYPNCLDDPDRLTDANSGHQHIPYGFALVPALEPRIVVALGIQEGDTFCSVCQVFDALGLDTRYCGVDPWRGEAQVGPSGDAGRRRRIRRV